MALTWSAGKDVAQLWSEYGQASLVLVLIAFVLLKIAFGRVYAWRALSNIHLVGQEIGSVEKRRMAYLASAKTMYQSGYQKFKEDVFRITTSRTVPVLVVHHKFLMELNRLSDTVLSVEEAVNESMEARYTKLSTLPMIPHTIKTQLTPGLVRLTPRVADEIRYAFSKELPACREYTPVRIHEKLLRIVAAASGRVFVGPDVCRQEQYLDTSMNFTTEVMVAQNAIQQMRQCLRPFLAHRLPEVQKLNKRRAEAAEFLRPIIHSRRENLRHTHTDQEKPDDMLQWLMESQPHLRDGGSKELTEQQLGISFAAIHTTTLTATNAFYNLAAMPDVATELRAEVQSVLDKQSGIFTSKALQDMTKLDSFLKETLRYHPFAFATYQRKVLKTFKLSNGRSIPAGTTLECPTYAINFDDEIYENAETFDAFRFFKIREDAKSKNEEVSRQNQFVSVSQNSLVFGYGRHACPGRFFAGTELKLLVAVALTEFDIMQTEGSTSRYPNLEFAQLSIPDPTKEILLKRRST